MWQAAILAYSRILGDWRNLPGWGGAAIASGKDFPYIAAMIKSKLTSKAQTTIPQSVRTALGLRAGDEVAYQIEGGRVIMTKATVVPLDDPFALFDEWDSEADRAAYAQL